MLNNAVGKYTGPGSVDVTDIQDDLLNVKDGDLQGYMREKPEFDAVKAELEHAMPTHGDRAGIHASVFATFTSKTALLLKIRAYKLVVGKLYEVLCESEIYYEDAREGDLIRMAKIILDAAHHDNQPDLLAVFNKLLKYRSQYAEKAAATRRKREEVKPAQPKAKAEEPAPAEKPA